MVQQSSRITNLAHAAAQALGTAWMPRPTPRCTGRASCRRCDAGRWPLGTAGKRVQLVRVRSSRTRMEAELAWAASPAAQLTVPGCLLPACPRRPSWTAVCLLPSACSSSMLPWIRYALYCLAQGGPCCIYLPAWHAPAVHWAVLARQQGGHAPGGPSLACCLLLFMAALPPPLCCRSLRSSSHPNPWRHGRPERVFLSPPACCSNRHPSATSTVLVLPHYP